MVVWFTLFLHETIELVLTPDVVKYFSDVFGINSAVLKVRSCYKLTSALEELL